MPKQTETFKPHGKPLPAQAAKGRGLAACTFTAVKGASGTLHGGFAPRSKRLLRCNAILKLASGTVTQATGAANDSCTGQCSPRFVRSLHSKGLIVLVGTPLAKAHPAAATGKRSTSAKATTQARKGARKAKAVTGTGTAAPALAPAATKTPIS